MYIDLTIFISFLIVALSFFTLFLVAGYLYLAKNRELNALNKEFTLFKSNADTEAKRIITSASLAASQTLSKTNLLTDEAKKSLLNSINKMSSDGVLTYEKLLEQLESSAKTQAEKIGDSMSQVMNQSAKEASEKLSIGSSQAVVEIQKAASGQSAMLQKAASQILEEEKKALKSLVASKAKKIIFDIAGKNIDDSDLEKYASERFDDFLNEIASEPKK